MVLSRSTTSKKALMTVLELPVGPGVQSAIGTILEQNAAVLRRRSEENWRLASGEPQESLVDVHTPKSIQI